VDLIPFKPRRHGAVLHGSPAQRDSQSEQWPTPGVSAPAFSRVRIVISFPRSQEGERGGRSATWRNRQSVASLARGGRFAALQLGDFGPRGRNFRQIRGPGLSPLPPMHVQPLKRQWVYHCPRTATLGLPVSWLRATRAGADPAPHASTSADMPLVERDGAEFKRDGRGGD
jgi:hypothetical protein